MSRRTLFSLSFAPVVAALLAVATEAQAQPSQSLQDGRHRGSNLSFRWTSSGTLTRNAATRIYEFRRSVDLVSAGEQPGQRRITSVTDVWRSPDNRRWSYVTATIGETRYEGAGLETPPNVDMERIAREGLPQFFLGLSDQILGRPTALPTVTTTPDATWHTTSSVSVQMSAEYFVSTSNTTFEKHRRTFSLRLYRDAAGQPWARFIARPDAEPVVLERYTVAEATLSVVPNLRRTVTESLTVDLQALVSAARRQSP